MAIVSGVLSDFGRGALANSSYDLHPEIWFIPSGNATKTPASLIATRPIIVTPTISTGAFTADLEPTDGLRPEVWFTIVIQWLDSAGNYVSKDFVPWKLYVPAAGGAISDLIGAPWNPVLAWWGSDAPLGEPVVNTLWLDPDTGELSIWSN
jgi:hypothetical protein